MTARTGPDPWASPAEQCGHILRRSDPTEALVLPGTHQIDARKVVHVALDPDDVLRNMEVALLYSLTSARLNDNLMPEWDAQKARGAPPTTNANWFTIAQWAVLTVGRNLRSGDAPHRASALPQAVRRRLTPAVLNLRSSDDRRVAAALSYGQVMVFVSVYDALLRRPKFRDLPRPASKPVVDPKKVAEELRAAARKAADAAARAPHDDALAAAAAAAAQRLEDELVGQRERRTALRFARQLGANVKKSWIGRPDFYEQVLGALAKKAGHQDAVRAAFGLYARASSVVHGRKDREGRSAADLIFEATLRIAAVEQVILDAAVTSVIDHVPRHYTAQAEGRLATFAERSLRVPRRIAQINSSRRIAGAAAVATDLWARIMTDQVMVVAFPAETIRLGRDIPRRDWRYPFYAPGLTKLSPSAGRLFDQFDRSLGDGRGAGAGDWRRFDDRMNFVANLLRSRQQDPTLFWQPFTDEDVVRVWNGGYPSRMADPFEQAVRMPWLPDELGNSPGDERPSS
jgi:hypothetical protein